MAGCAPTTGNSAKQKASQMGRMRSTHGFGVEPEISASYKPHQATAALPERGCTAELIRNLSEELPVEWVCPRPWCRAGLPPAQE